MHKSNKAQASIEFLMTYGWVLLVLTIIIASLLFYTSSIVNIFPEKCLFPKNIICNNFILYRNATHEGIKINFTNNMGYKINISNITFSYETGKFNIKNVNGIIDDGKDVLITENREISTSPLNFTKDVLTIRVEIIYNPCFNDVCENSNFTIKGTLIGKVNKK